MLSIISKFLILGQQKTLTKDRFDKKFVTVTIKKPTKMVRFSQWVVKNNAKSKMQKHKSIRRKTFNL